MKGGDSCVPRKIKMKLIQRVKLGMAGVLHGEYYEKEQQECICLLIHAIPLGNESEYQK